METRRGIERRRHPRIPVMMQVNYTNGEDFLVDYSTNLGPRGIFINTTRAIGQGEKIHVKFLLPGDERPIRVLGQVCWIRRRGDDPAGVVVPGIGVEFLHATDEAREAVAHFVDRFLVEPAGAPAPGIEDWQPEDWHKIHELYEGDRA